MGRKPNKPPQTGSQFLVYRTEDGKLKLDVRFEGETVWLTQQHMAELFQTTKQNVSLHIQNLFSEGELLEDSVVKDSLTTAADGKNYATKFFNLDVIISVGYRVKSWITPGASLTRWRRPRPNPSTTSSKASASPIRARWTPPSTGLHGRFRSCRSRGSQNPQIHRARLPIRAVPR
jgi:hypothetical protein